MVSETLDEKLELVPDLPGVYLFRDARGAVLYVGKARSLRKRLRQHFRDNAPRYGWAQVMYEAVADFEYTVTRTELEALILEATLIKEHNPRYNIRLSDDKSYPFLKLTEELYPRLILLRDVPQDAQIPRRGRPSRRRYHDPKRHEVHGPSSGRVFGPYPDARSLRRVVRLVSQLFGLRSCARRLDGSPSGKPCLNFHIGRCVGPCRGLEEVPREQYAQVVRQTIRFLEGRADEVAAELEKEMRAAAEALEFERAARLRDRLKAIRRTTEGQVVVATKSHDQDVIGVASEEDRALVVLLRIRAGRLVAQEQYVFRRTEGHAAADVVEAFFTQHYVRATELPAEILVCTHLEEAAEWSELLSQLRGRRVRVHHPSRGDRRALVELAEKNARVALQALTRARAESEASSRAALADLADALGLPAPPARIECFDVSTTQGRASTGSQVVFTNGQPDRRNYRRFRMHQTDGKPDDYAMMAEMVRRRVRRGLGGDAKFLPMPDLILVDGGKGQLGVVTAVLREEGLDGIPVAALAKEREEVFVPGRPEPVDMSEHRAAQFLLQRLRDEAHRFALTHHRGLRDSQMTRSVLDEIPGIGPVRKRALLEAFASVQEIAQASVEELAAVPGMNRAAAETLRRHLVQATETASPK